MPAPNQLSSADQRYGLAVITVTYHPDAARLAEQIAALPDEALLVIVDNASTESERHDIRHIASTHARSQVLENTVNVGLGAAINAGVAHIEAVDPHCEFLLLLDQDSVPAVDAVDQLVTAFLRLEHDGERVGSVGPRLIDGATNLQYGFHTLHHGLLRREFPPADSTSPVRCIGISGSGTLVRASIFRELGALDPGFFIDHTDTEWSFKVLAAGYGLFGIPQARFNHRMGERGIAYWWFGWRVWPHRTPQRQYFVFRNAIRLLRRPYVPAVWKFWSLVKLAMTIAMHGIFDRERGVQLRNMLGGIRDGLRNV